MNSESIPELQRLGLRLAQARQALGISLDQQAERLHMGPEQLRALEEGNREELPEAVFVVAQARRVATSLGLNIDEDIAALRSSPAFQTRLPQRQQHLQSRPLPASAPASAPARPVPAGPVDSPTPARRSGPPRRLLGLAAALLVAAGLTWGVQRSVTGARPAPSPLQPNATSGTSSPVRTPDPSPNQAELVLSSAEPSWLEVRSAGGELLFRGTLQGEQRFPLNGELQVLAGRPDLVSATSGGAPAQPLGPIEAVTWYAFSPDVSRQPERRQPEQVPAP